MLRYTFKTAFDLFFFKYLLIRFDFKLHNKLEKRVLTF